MAHQQRPSMAMRIQGFSIFFLGAAGLYAGLFFSSGFEQAFLIFTGLLFGGPGLLVMLRGY